MSFFIILIQISLQCLFKPLAWNVNQIETGIKTPNHQTDYLTLNQKQINQSIFI